VGDYYVVPFIPEGKMNNSCFNVPMGGFPPRLTGGLAAERQTRAVKQVRHENLMPSILIAAAGHQIDRSR
jgi:hypothetical protein